MFKPQFAPLVESGAKRQTIRPVPKGRRPLPGDLESWRAWLGKPYRSKTRVLAVVELTMVLDFEMAGPWVMMAHGMRINGQPEPVYFWRLSPDAP